MAIRRAHGVLSNKEVVSSDGRDLGHVKDLEVETDNWKVVGVVVKLNRDVLEDVHLKKPLIGTQEIVVATAHVSSVGDKVLLSKNLQELGQLGGATDGPEDDKPGS